MESLSKSFQKKPKGTQTQQCTLQDVIQWLNWADADYVSARILFLSGTPIVWFSAAVLAQQALEKLFKAVLLSYGKSVSQQGVWGHDLEQLARDCTDASLQLDDATAQFFHSDFYLALRKFTAYFNELRYPTKLKNVEGLGLEELDLLDNLVSVVRSRIRFGVESIPPKFEELYPESSAPFTEFVRAAREKNRFWRKF